MIKRKIILALLFILLSPGVLALASWREVDVKYNLTVNITDNVLVVWHGTEMLLTKNLINTTEFQYQHEETFSTLVDNKIYLTTTNCNTSDIAAEVSGKASEISSAQTAAMKEYIDLVNQKLDNKLEPISSVQGRLYDCERDADSQRENVKLCEGKLLEKDLSVKQADFAKEQAEAKATAAGSWKIIALILLLVICLAITGLIISHYVLFWP